MKIAKVGGCAILFLISVFSGMMPSSFAGDNIQVQNQQRMVANQSHVEAGYPGQENESITPELFYAKLMVRSLSWQSSDDIEMQQIRYFLNFCLNWKTQPNPNKSNDWKSEVCQADLQSDFIPSYRWPQSKIIKIPNLEKFSVVEFTHAHPDPMSEGTSPEVMNTYCTWAAQQLGFSGTLR